MAVMVWLVGENNPYTNFLTKYYGWLFLQWIDLQGETSLQEAMVNYNLR